MYCSWCSPCCSCRVYVLCLAARLRQWAVDVFEAVQRPSSVPLQIHGCLSEPFHSRIPLCVSPRPHVLHVPERVVVGVCLSPLCAAWFGCTSHCALSLPLFFCRSIVFHHLSSSLAEPPRSVVSLLDVVPGAELKPVPFRLVMCCHSRLSALLCNPTSFS